ncbi:extracellular solute-binding protein [Paenibacillus agricola]|uniref:Extracellular solute-binding protein n=1 Tax=Paenibacillus agricola TaxID=2716264 RepID=A0ABX0JIB7_9BACL|nr:extracellular solute-binding protein [Paenibacillus agricola]NHN33626.1 extracellular solute-binding protein [Paenibacillus agricola]
MRIRGNRKKPLMLTFTMVLALSSILAACGAPAATDTGAKSGGEQGTAAPANAAPVEIKVLTSFSTPTPPENNGDVQKAIEKATNSKLNIQWVSGNNYKDRLNVTLSSGDIPDVVMIDDPFSALFRKMAKEGSFWDLTNYYKDYPNISSKIAPVAWESTKLQDGKNYGVPRPRGSEGARFFILRKDWLDKLGLKMPTTTDELYTAMKAFKEKDPDGNGKADTIGYTGNVNANDMGTLGLFVNSFTGATGNWKDQSGKLVYTDLMPETKQALEFLNKAYKEGLIPADFASLKASQVDDIYSSGKAGIIGDKTGSTAVMVEKLKQTDPTSSGDFNVFYPATNINQFNPKGPGYLGILAISKKVPEAKMKQILTVIDKWMAPAVFDLQTWGLEGVHHTVKDGKKELIKDKYNASGIENFNQFVYVADPYANSFHPTFPKEAIDAFTKIQDEKAKTSKADESVGLYSETFLTYGPELAKQAQDVKTKVILGLSPMSAWDDFINQLKANPQMTKITQEINDSYTARKSGK